MPGGNPLRNGRSPRNGIATASATIAESITVNRASTENSRRMISTPKNTPVIGALNVAAMPPPAPQATRIRIRFSGVRTHWPSAGGQRGADLHDRALPADRPAGADAQRRGERLDHADRHLFDRKSRIKNAEDPHPNPPPAYREREECLPRYAASNGFARCHRHHSRASRSQRGQGRQGRGSGPGRARDGSRNLGSTARPARSRLGRCRGSPAALAGPRAGPRRPGIRQPGEELEVGFHADRSIGSSRASALSPGPRRVFERAGLRNSRATRPPSIANAAR